MAVQEQTPQIEYVANGVTKSFPLTFDCEDQDHLIVTVNDVELSVGSWMLIDENVSFKVAPANGSNIVIQRNTPMQRTTTYQTYNNSFRPEPVNKDFDRIWWKLQELGFASSITSAKLAIEIVERIKSDKKLQDQITSNDLDIEQLFFDITKEVEARIKGDREVALSSREYTDFMMRLSSTNPSIFDGVSDNIVMTENGDSQRQINRYIKEHGAALPWKPGIKYALHATVTKDDGTLVQSTIAGNTTNPNIDMTKWESPLPRKTTSFGNMHRRKVLHDLIWNFPEHDAWVLASGGDLSKTTIGYGSLQIDTVEREIWLYGTTDNSKVGKYYAYFVIYDLDTGEYKKAYRTSLDNLPTSCEGFVLTRYFGTRKLFTVGVEQDKVYEFDIEWLPESGSDIRYSKTYSVMDVGEQMALDEATGLFYFESNTPSIAAHSDRKILVSYNSDFTKIFGHIDVGIHNSGYVTDTRAGGAGKYFHKRQGFAVYGGCIALSFGGGANSNYNSKPQPDYHTHQQGVRVINMGAETIQESFFDPAKYIKKRNAALGVNYYECEHEGVAYTPDGRLYTFEVAYHLLHRQGKPGGWLITEVFSNAHDAIDYSDCATNRSHTNMLHPLFLNRMAGNSWINPYTGEYLKKLEDLFTFMLYTQKSEVSFIASGVHLQDVDGVGLNSKYGNKHIKVLIESTRSFLFEVVGEFSFRYTSNGSTWSKVGIVQSLKTLDYGDLYRSQIRAENATPGASDILIIDQQSTQNGNTLIIGGGASVTTSATSVCFATSAEPSVNGGDIRCRVTDTAFRGERTNSFDLGTAAHVFRDSYFQNSPIITSDERQKQQFRSQTNREKTAALEIKNSICLFKFNDAVDLKGDGARWHVGVKAQQVISILESNDLNPFDYAFVCFDSWEAEGEITESWDDELDEENNLIREAGSAVIQDAIAAGSRYAIRYDELTMFVLSAI